MPVRRHSQHCSAAQSLSRWQDVQHTVLANVRVRDDVLQPAEVQMHARYAHDLRAGPETQAMVGDFQMLSAPSGPGKATVHYGKT